MNNYVLDYWREIETGGVVVGAKVRKLYGRLADEIQDPPDPWVFDLERGARPIEFIERFCKQSKGEWIGKPIILELRQKAYVQALFGFVHTETGERRFKETLLLVVRKNGKSTLLSGIGIFMKVATARRRKSLQRCHQA